RLPAPRPRGTVALAGRSRGGRGSALDTDRGRARCSARRSRTARRADGDHLLVRGARRVPAADVVGMRDVVDRVLDALNAHDVEAFVACYAEDATIENGYDEVGARGHDGLRERYGPMFEKFPDIRVTALSRTDAGPFVVQ